VSAATFPPQFSDLERLSMWALPTESERNVLRRSSAYADIKDVYDTVLLRIDAMLDYLDEFPLDNMPDDAGRLLLLALALSEVAPAVEYYGQPTVVDGFDADRVTIYQ
jgi:hypothetical protein